jgi:hypothetical protein
MKVAVFSGRFDPPHIGHIMSIHKLSTSNDIVIIPILDYCDRFISSESACEVFNSVFEHYQSHSLIIFLINFIHFAKITAKEYDDLLKQCGIDQGINDVTYYAGNKEVLDNFNAMGINCVYLDRSMDEVYTGTKIREAVNGKQDNPKNIQHYQ